MAIVETVDTDSEIVGIDRPDASQQGIHIDLPNWNDTEATGTFLGKLDSLDGMRGVKTLHKYVKKYLDAIHLAERHMKQVKISVNTVNGITVPRPVGVSNELRKFKRASKTYFNALSTPELRKQCGLFGLDYDSYDSMEAAIAALVDANVAVRNK
jgi:hypothetical protein